MSDRDRDGEKRKGHLIVALDVPDIDRARMIVSSVGAHVSVWKIGYQLIPVGGFSLARELSEQGHAVFLDLKFHDIGATVERGVRSVCALGADFLTVHAEPDVLVGAVRGRGDDERLKLLAVTVLTSLDQAALSQMGIARPLEDVVLDRARMAQDAGADGVIASAREAQAIRAATGPDFLIVTPGIRPEGAATYDQARTVTPQDAMAAGATHIVVGRPIVEAADPATAAAQIVRELQ